MVSLRTNTPFRRRRKKMAGRITLVALRKKASAIRGERTNIGVNRDSLMPANI
jgi:hypothetical protein